MGPLTLSRFVLARPPRPRGTMTPRAPDALIVPPSKNLMSRTRDSRLSYRGRSPPLIYLLHRDGVPLAGSAARKAQDDLTAAIKLAPPQRCGRGTRCARAATMLLPARARARIHSLMHATLAPNLVLARLTALLRVYCRLHVLQARAIGIRCSTGACHRPPFGRVGDSRPGFRLSAQRPPPPPPPPLRRDEGR